VGDLPPTAFRSHALSLFDASRERPGSSSCASRASGRIDRASPSALTRCLRARACRLGRNSHSTTGRPSRAPARMAAPLPREAARVRDGGHLSSRGEGWKRPRFEDHLLDISRKDISPDVPMGLDVGAVAPPDRTGHHFCDQRPERPQAYVPRPQQPNEGPSKVLIFDDNRPLVLPQGSPQLRSARYTHGNRWRELRRLSVNVVGLQQRSRPHSVVRLSSAGGPAPATGMSAAVGPVIVTSSASSSLLS
jgi:hypothetical protein